VGSVSPKQKTCQIVFNGMTSRTRGLKWWIAPSHLALTTVFKVVRIWQIFIIHMSLSIRHIWRSRFPDDLDCYQWLRAIRKSLHNELLLNLIKNDVIRLTERQILITLALLGGINRNNNKVTHKPVCKKGIKVNCSFVGRQIGDISINSSFYSAAARKFVSRVNGQLTDRSVVYLYI
jgi:hypothetical protein